MKIAVIGGGSTYTPELADGIARLLPAASEVVLQDPDTERLAAVGPVSARIMKRYGHPGTLRWTSSLDDAADGADVLLYQLRVGGQATRDRDETWPAECGCIGQETTGAGGLAKALRTVPVLLDISQRIAGRASPSAWIIDFTNPVGIVTRALRTAGYRAIGLCNVAIGFQRRFAAMLGTDPESVSLGHVGLNHLTWERSVTVDGKDMLPELLAPESEGGHGDEIAADIELPASLIRHLGMIPSYYLRYYYAHDTVLAERRGKPTRARAVAEIEAELLRLYQDPALDRKPDILARRGGAFYSEAAVELLAGLTGAAMSAAPQVVNITNGTTLPFLPPDAVIEVPAAITTDGAAPLPVDPVGPLLRGLISHVFAYEELALDAAVRGGRDRVFDALLAHPLVGQHDVAECLTGKLLAENARFLPWA